MHVARKEETGPGFFFFFFPVKNLKDRQWRAEGHDHSWRFILHSPLEARMLLGGSHLDKKQKVVLKSSFTAEVYYCYYRCRDGITAYFHRFESPPSGAALWWVNVADRMVWAEAMCSADAFRVREDAAMLGHQMFTVLNIEIYQCNRNIGQLANLLSCKKWGHEYFLA